MIEIRNHCTMTESNRVAQNCWIPYVDEKRILSICWQYFWFLKCTWLHTNYSYSYRASFANWALFKSNNIKKIKMWWNKINSYPNGNELQLSKSMAAIHVLSGIYILNSVSFWCSDPPKGSSLSLSVILRAEILRRTSQCCFVLEKHWSHSFPGCCPLRCLAVMRREEGRRAG